MSDAGPRFIFHTDCPPLARNATANHGIAAHYIRIMRERFSLVLTHRFRRQIDPAAVVRDFPMAKFQFYPDSSAFGIKRFNPGFADLLDMALCFFALPRLLAHVREEKPDRIFVISGNIAWFLVIAWIFHRASGLPMDVFVVDDLHDSAHLSKRYILARLVRRIEGFVLRRSARVFGISPGYADHLRQVYGVDARWLPTPIQAENIEYHPYVPASPDVRDLLFVGSCNDLYLASLAEIYRAIKTWNASGKPWKLRLKMLCPVRPDNLIELLPDTDDLAFQVQAPPDVLAAAARECWATLLPYSFLPEMKTLVSTSFSWKLNDAYRGGRPILVYGPEYASIPRYFREENLPLLTTRNEDLPAALEQIAPLDNADLIARYREVWHRYHSPEAVIRHLNAV